MYFSFGKHRWKNVEQVLLIDPSYVCWMWGLAKVDGGMAEVRREAARLMAIFNDKPFTVNCRCGGQATRCMLYVGNPSPEFWCDQCDPYSGGASPGRLREIQTYLEAATAASTRDGVKNVVQEIARAKGLGDRITHDEAEAFFSDGEATSDPSSGFEIGVGASDQLFCGIWD